MLFVEEFTCRLVGAVQGQYCPLPQVGFGCCPLDPVSAPPPLFAAAPCLGASAINLTLLCSSVDSSCQVYRFSSEAKTFLRNCGDLLNMSSHSDTAIMRQLETVLEGRIDVDVDSDVCLHVSHDAESWKASR